VDAGATLVQLSTDYVFDVDKDACEEELERLFGLDEADAIEGAQDMKPKTTLKAEPKDAAKDLADAAYEAKQASNSATHSESFAKEGNKDGAEANAEGAEAHLGDAERALAKGVNKLKSKKTLKAAGKEDALDELGEATEALSDAKKAAADAKTLVRKNKFGEADSAEETAINQTETAEEKLDDAQQNTRVAQEFGAKKTLKAAEGEFPNFEKKDKKDDEPKSEKKDDEPKAEDKKEEKSEKKDDEPKKEKKSPKAGEIEIVKDGEVIETFPDAFGDDSVSVIKFFRKLYAITDKDDKAAVKKEEKGEKKEEKAEDIEKMPKALPKVDEPKEEKKDAKEMAAPFAPAAQTENFVKVTAADQKELDAVKAFFEKRVKLTREIVAALVEKNHVCAEQSDIDANLLQGKDLETAVDEALKLSADRKFKELQAQTDADLLSLKASLPNLKPRSAKVDIAASKEIEGGLSLMELSILATVNHEGKKDAQFSIGAAFGAGLF